MRVCFFAKKLEKICQKKIEATASIVNLFSGEPVEKFKF
jgi:hypothetical protein